MCEAGKKGVGSGSIWRDINQYCGLTENPARLGGGEGTGAVNLNTLSIQDVL